MMVPEASCTASTQPTIGSNATGAQRTTKARERSRTGPSVLRLRNTAPCTRQKPITASPPRTAYPFNQANGPPTRSPFASIGRPVVVSVSIAPTPNAARNEPMPRARSHQARQRSVTPLPRYSMATARKISPSSVSVNGMYRVENSEAYQSGNAANVAAPAVMSHTSLPSQTGPMLFSISLRWFSVRAETSMCIPTPRSKPSSSR